jgi:carbamoyltransferase
MRLLGLSTETHDSGIALLEDGHPTDILEEERLNREKHTREFPRLSLAALFDDERRIGAIDAVTTCWDPSLLRRSLISAVCSNLPASLALMMPASHPTQDSGIVVLNYWLRKGLRRQFPSQDLPPLINVAHHDAHAAIYFVSPFQDATIIVMDGYGDESATSVYTANGDRVERRWQGRFFDSLGLVYTLITRHLGFNIFEEGTVMALAACGRETLVNDMRDIVRLVPQGGFSANMSYFSYDRFGAMRPFKRKFIDAFGPARKKGEPLTQHHMDLARALQTVAEEVVLHVAQAARKSYPSENLCLTGGVALNCIANARILREGVFKHVWVPPCASDTGGPLGSTLWHYHQTLQKPRTMELTHAFYGLEYRPWEVREALENAGLHFEELDEGALVSRVARDLANDQIIGWHQGRYEIGPRSLGNRSILASPLNPGIRDVINTRVKFREPFRPFAPSVLEEYASDYFDLIDPSPFMTFACNVRPQMGERIPAAIHVDNTARVQTVARATNPRYHLLIEAFREITGVPVLLNTSFNKQEPIVTTPEQAISCFLRTDMNVLVMGDFYCRDRPKAAVQRARAAFHIMEVNTSGGE